MEINKWVSPYKKTKITILEYPFFTIIDWKSEIDKQKSMNDCYNGIFNSKEVNAFSLSNSDEESEQDESVTCSGSEPVAANTRPNYLMYYNSFSYNSGTYGTVSKDGELTNFVADNLECKIKLSSPITKGVIANERLSASQHKHLIHLDLNILNDIEIEAQYLAANVDTLIENLCSLLHSVSSITADNVDLYKNAICKLADGMDANIKSMYTIMAKTEEMSKAMKPTEQIAQKIREIKRLVEIFDNNL